MVTEAGVRIDELPVFEGLILMDKRDGMAACRHPGDAEKMIAAWGPYEGKLYEGNELEAFWGEMAPFLPPEWHIELHLAIRQDPKTATADLGVLLPGATR